MALGLVELLAHFRPDPHVEAELEKIDDDTAPDLAVIPPGTVKIDSWLARREASTAQLAGRFCDVTNSTTVAALHPRFKALSAIYGLHDFDAAALKIARPRELTQAVSQYLWEAKTSNGDDLCDGIKFRPRHGDNFKLWAIYERPGDPPTTPHITNASLAILDNKAPEILEAATLLGLTLC